ncbi:hypothetical protein CPB86DRAFT_705961 [Serendipita vermifera]|nr:hypothetical protein CPB86DRAFT_705961 [Serendipita vermifera]
MDLAERITALQRKKASAESAPRTRGLVAIPATTPRAERPTAGGLNESTSSADRAIRRPQETSPRRPTLSNHQQEPRTKHLFDPNSDPIPKRPRQIPDSNMTSPTHSQPPSRQLFDYRKDDPVRFAVLNNQAHRERQAPSSIQSSSVMDHSSISSYTSSTWTLTSSTGTSQSSAPPEQATDKEGSSKFVSMLKRIYREIAEYEKKIKEWDNHEDGQIPSAAITMLKPGTSLASVEESENSDPLRMLVAQHKQLAELYHSMITMILQPVPASMLSFVKKYSLPSRLWMNGITHCIECLRRMSGKLPGAAEHMTGYILWSYHFYESLYETSTMNEFMAPYKVNWIEALGDLARYHMHVSARQSSQEMVDNAVVPLTEEALPPAPPAMPRGDDTPPPSIGIAAANAFDLEPESEIWRKASQTWYAMVLQETPGAGKLHHNMGLLNSEISNEELRGVYHFVKSMTATHPYPTSREAILSLFSKPAQQRRNLADSKAPELFVRLHGMLFTNIQLDDFQPTLARFLERLQLDGAQEREWIMMAAINIAAVLQYGKEDGMIKVVGGTGEALAEGRKKELVQKMDSLAMNDTSTFSSSGMDVDSPMNDEPMVVDPPIPLQLALKLTFSMLSFCLRHPLRRSSAFARPTLNPYITALLTFVFTVLKQPGTLAIIERSFPWDDLVNFLSEAPRSMQKELEGRAKLTSGCAPLPEDWCMRGMAWTIRRVYEHGFWTRGAGSSSAISSEMDVLSVDEGIEQDTDGIIETEERGEETGPKDYTRRRWVRIIRSCVGLLQTVPGFELGHGETGPEWRLGDVMRRKAEMWKEEERIEREEEERRRHRLWEDDDLDQDMEVDSDEEEELDDDPVVRALQERRRYLRNLQKGRSSQSMSRPSHRSRLSAPSRAALNVRPGYSVLVVDTNVLLSALHTIASLIESNRWTILIPLAVITELDGISANQSELGDAAAAAFKYISEHMRSHSTSLKVQTSRGNYLNTLNVRSENFDFNSRGGDYDDGSGHHWERNLDDLILRAALWQEAHWVDRSALLKGGVTAANQQSNGLNEVAKVVLLSFDRNLRLKARARHMHAGDERDLANIVRVGS